MVDESNDASSGEHAGDAAPAGLYVVSALLLLSVVALVFLLGKRAPV